MNSITANIHSIETCGTVDGPGIRFVIFFQGCPLRCQYCHNPDTWKVADGTEKTLDELFSEILKYKSYMKYSGGGITASGGEPALQAEFLTALFKRCHEEGIHTTLDTSGFVFNDQVKELLAYTDLVMLDLKHYNKDQYKTITGVALQPTLDFLSYLDTIHMPIWLRYVLVPGLSDQLEDIDAMGQFLSGFDTIERIEVLPFHKMGEYKWEELGYEYQLKETQEPNQQLINQVVSTLRNYHDRIVCN